MSVVTPIEERLSAVEAAVAEIRQRLSEPRPDAGWLAQVIGSFKDEPAFEEVLAHGRAFREADRPADEEE